LLNMAVRVAPMMRTPRYQSKYATTSAPMPLYATAPHAGAGTAAQRTAASDGAASTPSSSTPPTSVHAEICSPSMRSV
jgi:hypothetical protein